CRGWDPEQGEENDPEGCLRARQYRQVQRVLRRENLREHQHWWFTYEPNVATLYNLTRCFLPTDHANYTRCPDRPVIVNGYWWSAMTIHHGTSGEVIWQESVLKQFESYGIMTLFVGAYENWITVAEMMPNVYRFVWAPELEIISCFTDPRCVAAEHYVPPLDAEDLSLSVPNEERGVIPIWRLQIVDYWGSLPKEVSNNDWYWGLTEHGEWSYHSLGTAWISTPWPMPNHVHLPYSIEEYCLSIPVKPHDERNNSVLIFAKRSSYFHLPHMPPKHFWTDLSREPNFDLLSTADDEAGKPMPEGLSTLGRQSREAYEDLVGSSKVLLGMGHPPISPSVYTALCQGTPVVLPYRALELNLWKGGFEYYAGYYQHGPAMAIGPPYVYSYQQQNYTMLLEMVNKALVTPIERYIPDDMKLPYALKQSKAFLNRDLHAMFRKVLRKNGGQVPRLKAGARERCAEINRCEK
ncbi:uncharacterized protein MKK02DRAFT_10347, partial [Dioszegia hungarica]